MQSSVDEFIDQLDKCRTIFDEPQKRKKQNIHKFGDILDKIHVFALVVLPKSCRIFCNIWRTSIYTQAQNSSD